MEKYSQIKNIISTNAFGKYFRIERNDEEDMTWVMWDVDRLFGGLCLEIDHRQEFCMLYVLNEETEAGSLVIQNRTFSEGFKRLISLLCAVNSDSCTFNDTVYPKPLQYLWLIEDAC